MDLSGYVHSGTGTPKVGLTVELWLVAGVAAEASTTTDSNGYWEFTGLSTAARKIKIVDGLKALWLDGRSEIQVTNIDVVTALTTDAINEHTSAAGVTVDGVLIKDGLVDGVDVSVLPNRNGIINGDFKVAQSGTAFTSATAPANSDDTYLLDNWILLSDGNDIVDVTQVVRATPNGAYAEMKAEVETPNKQFGFLTILEARDAARFIGQAVSFSFKARMAAADDNTHSLKAVILSWGSTADAVTSDVVDAWSATPTYVANWTAENTPASQTLTTTEQTFKVEGVAIDTASTTNIAVFIFCDQTDGAVDDAVIITGLQIEVGAVATPFEFRPYQQELELCKRYYERIFSGVAYSAYAQGCNADTIHAFAPLFFSEKRVNPTVAFSAVDDFQVQALGSGIATTAATSYYTSRKSSLLYFTVAAGLTAGQGCNIIGKNSTTHYMTISARL